MPNQSIYPSDIQTVLDMTLTTQPHSKHSYKMEEGCCLQRHVSIFSTDCQFLLKKSSFGNENICDAISHFVNIQPLNFEQWSQKKETQQSTLLTFNHKEHWVICFHSFLQHQNHQKQCQSILSNSHYQYHNTSQVSYIQPYYNWI